MKYRKLRIAWSVVWGVVAVLLCVLWVSSNWWQGLIRIRMPGYRNVASITWSGWSSFEYYWANPTSLADPSGFPTSELLFRRVSGPRDTIAPGRGWLWTHRSDNQSAMAVLRVPCWFTTIVAAACAAIPWLFWLPHRFSLRTLLFATTLVGVGLGVIAWMT
jgi:hypothetical protein